MTNETRADVIGGFPTASDNCLGCGKPLLLDNAWVTDGCPCNTPLGINNDNETRWRLLMQLQQRDSREAERLRKVLGEIAKALPGYDAEAAHCCKQIRTILTRNNT
jgi:hypothetical protein